MWSTDARVRPHKWAFDREDTTLGAAPPLTDDKNKTLDLKNPPNVERKVEYDPATRQYVITETIGGRFYRNPTYMSFEDYLKYEAKQSQSGYFRQRSNENSLVSGSIVPKLYVNNQVFDRIFGGSKVDIRPQGSAELIFSGKFNRNDNPLLSERQRRTQFFDFDEKIQMNVVGSIGDKLKITTNYNTEATFDFENQMKLEYTGYEDEIIKKIELGNVSLPLNSSLISGSQSLFGVKTQLQFGKLTVTSVFSQQKSEKKQIKITNGAQTTDFKFSADNYEGNKHYFLAQYFRDTYNQSLVNYPAITSNVLINKVEVWVTDKSRNGQNETRDVIGLIDLGENERTFIQDPSFQKGFNPYPNSVDAPGSPASNNLLSILPGSFRTSSDNTVNSYFNDKGGPDNYAKIRARKLTDREFSFHPQLGYISLNSALNADEVLAVSFRYTVNGVEYTVGEFSNERPETNPPTVLFVKLLKNVSVRTALPIWDLMMKNIYSLNAFQVNSKDFRLDVLYLDEKTSNNINYLPEGPANVKNVPLIRVLGVDRLDSRQTLTPDGIFDFVDGITVNSSNGRIIFPRVEPFGRDLLSAFGADSVLGKTYAFTELYDSTRYRAQQIPKKNKFTISGSFQSTSNSEFSLNAINIPQGSVVVKSGTTVLTEGVDYTVDYNVGRVKIVNQGVLNSGSPITVDLESSTLFGVQSKTFFGSRFDYKYNDKLNLGATFVRLSERPLTQKVNIGDEPIANNMYGFDVNYRTDSRFLTTLVDRIPLIETKAKSTVTVSAEYARLDPGHSRLLNTKTNKRGVSYIDDFEGSKSAIDMRNAGSWFMSSTPAMFPESNSYNLDYGYNRARLAFYQIDNLFHSRTNNATPGHIKNDRDQLSNHYVREVREDEVFQNKQTPTGQPNILSTLDLSFYPRERGPYNFTINGIDANGRLRNPAGSWGGIMRRMESNDFEALNVEYIEFWVMDPFLYNRNSPGGDLYFNLGNISEDILKDGAESIENALPKDGDPNKIDTTVWGRVGVFPPLTTSFDNDPNSRKFQDIGLDGLADEDERTFFKQTYLDLLEQAYGTSSVAYQEALGDPSADNYTYYRGSNLDNVQATILDRYKRYNGQEGNSPTEQQSRERTGLSNTAATPNPDTEDINRDNSQSDRDEYFQYRIPITPQDLENPGEGSYVADKVVSQVKLINGKTENVTWYQFIVPIRSYESRVGDIDDFKSIRFVRAFLTNFTDTVVLRFARMQLVRGEWRKLDASNAPGETQTPNPPATFNLSTVNIEENGNREPIPYKLPPGVEQERDLSNVRGDTRINEQSLSLNVCDLRDGNQVMAYKNTSYDFRSYKKVEMFIHAEGKDVRNNDVNAFIRFGTDYSDNYYEYEIPLQITPDGSTNPTTIWPDYNKLEIPFSILQIAKQHRNSEGYLPSKRYRYSDGKNTIWVQGSPDLSNVRAIVIGVRNPGQTVETPGDDGMAKCVQVWVNELRLTDFDEEGGWAATGRINAQLADFANVTLSGSRSTYGFGSIEKKVSERSRTDDRQYDISSTVELGKFLPEKTGLRVPMYVAYSEAVSTPQYAPNNPDILLANVLNELSERERDSLKRITESYTKRKSINFTNVKKERTDTKKKPKVYDVENLSATYAFTEEYRRSYNTEYFISKTYKGAIGYSFASQAQNIKPFDKAITNKNLRLIKDFNFNTRPNAFDFRMDVDRTFGENKVRDINNSNLIIAPTYNKDFRITRVYGMKYDITRSLKLDFTANNLAVVDEPYGRIDNEQKRDSVLDNLYKLGRTTDYYHNLNISYAVPINKLPYMDWTTLNTTYTARYDWKGAPPANENFANTISNSRSIQVTPQLNMVTLYGRSKYLKNLSNQKNFGNSSRNNPLEKLKKVTPEQAKKDSIERELNKMDFKKFMARTLISLKTVNVTYKQTEGTLLPGYTRRTDILGSDLGEMSPGFGFIFGSQKDIRYRAASQGWITTYDSITNRYVTSERTDVNIRATFEPLPDMRIDLSGNRSISRNYQEFFKYSPSDGRFVNLSPTETGTFSITYNTWNTAFEKMTDDGKSKFFTEFENNRIIISQRLAAENNASVGVDSTGFNDGYGRYSQEVLIPAFLAAYSGKNAANISTNPFPKIPKPNWRVSYSGLSRIEFVKQYFNNFVVNHGYTSTYSVNSFNKPTTTLERYAANNNFVPTYEIQAVSISEQFSPLIGFDMTMKNDITVTMDYKQGRNLGLSFANTRLEQLNTREYTIGIGYVTNNLKLPFTFGNGQTVLKNDLNFKLDFSIRYNRGVVHFMDVNRTEIINGSRVIAIKPSIDYVINQRFQARIFYDRLVTKPFISQTFPTAITSLGFSLRLNIGA